MQSPDDAQFPAMPESALEYTIADHVLPAVEIGPLLAELHTRPVSDEEPRTAFEEMELELRMAKEGRGLQAGVMELGESLRTLAPSATAFSRSSRRAAFRASVAIPGTRTRSTRCWRR